MVTHQFVMTCIGPLVGPGHYAFAALTMSLLTLHVIMRESLPPLGLVDGSPEVSAREHSLCILKAFDLSLTS